MQYLIYLLVFITGSLCTIALDKGASYFRIRKHARAERLRHHIRAQHILELEARGLLWPSE